MTRLNSRPGVFLDRDGVVNEAHIVDGRPFPPRTFAELRLLPGVVDACRRLDELGYALVLVTNQPDIARGTQSIAEVDRMHDYLRKRLPLTDVVVCAHDDADDCACRKPRPGMLIDAAERLGLDLPRSFCVGDRWRDVEAAKAAGVRAIHVQRHYRERPVIGADATVDSLAEAVRYIELLNRGTIRGGVPIVERHGLKHVQIYADGADLEGMIELANRPDIAGFTTNPTLMHKSGINDYEAFARKVLDTISDHPISFEVFADDAAAMVRQARLIASWGDNVVVKIPVTNTDGESMVPVVDELTRDGVKLNVTALMTVAQVERIVAALAGTSGAIVSVFAGRIADTGRDPIPIMASALKVTRSTPRVELLWASPREILNVRQADDLGVDIITVTRDLLNKLSLFGRSLEDYSLDTVRMFHDDARAAGFTL